MSASLYQAELSARVSFHIMPQSDLSYLSLWRVPEQTLSSTVHMERHSQVASRLQSSSVSWSFFWTVKQDDNQE